jgi:hypothetical protein
VLVVLLLAVISISPVGRVGVRSPSNAATVLLAGALGGSSVFGGPGAPGAVSSAGSDSSAYGSGGSSDGVAATNGRPAGGAGGYCEKVFTAPAATYSYGVGAGGAAGTGGRKGGGGFIYVEEFYD